MAVFFPRHGIDHFDDALPQMAASAAVEEVDKKADRSPGRQHDHRLARQVEEQEQASRNGRRPHEPKPLDPEMPVHIGTPAAQYITATATMAKA